MKIFILIRAVVDSCAPLVMSDSGNLISSSWIINPFDEVAMESACQLRAQFCGSAELIAVGYNDVPGRAALERALAIGADRAIALQGCAPAQQNIPFVESAVLVEELMSIISQEQPELILTGRMAYGQEQGEVAPMLAGELGWPLAMCVCELMLMENEFPKLSILQRRPESIHRATLKLPAVISCDLNLATPRYISLPALAMAKKKPQSLWATQRSSCDFCYHWQKSQALEKERRVLNNTDELVHLLAREGIL